MRLHGLLLAILTLLFGAIFQPGDNAPVITTPVSGAVLQGVVDVRGSSAVEGFIAAELSFAYMDDPTWFPLAQSSQPVREDSLATWDTTAIADGVYALRLVVFRSQDSPLEVVVSGLRVRNYSPVETATRSVMRDQVTRAVPTATLAPLALLATPTALPANPAQVNRLELIGAVTQGIVITLFVFISIGVYAGARRLSRGA